MNISTAWADAVKYVKEFVSLGLALSKTDMCEIGSHFNRRYRNQYQTNADFVVMNTALEYCSMFLEQCIEEFPEEIDDDQLLEDLVAWHEKFNFHLWTVCNKHAKSHNMNHFHGTVVRVLRFVGYHRGLAEDLGYVLAALRRALDRLELIGGRVVEDVLLRHFAIWRIYLVPHHEHLRVRAIFEEAADPAVHVGGGSGIRYIVYYKSDHCLTQKEARHRPVLLLSCRIPNVESISHQSASLSLYMHLLPIFALQNDILCGERRSDCEAVCCREAVLREPFDNASAHSIRSTTDTLTCQRHDRR